MLAFLCIVLASAASTLLVWPELASLVGGNERPPASGPDAMVGETGRVAESADDLFVLVRGERWRADALGSGPLSPGQRVVVRAVEGLRVRVEPVGPAAVAPAAPRSSHRPRWAGLCLWGAASALSLFALESPTLVVLGVPLASLIALAGLSLLGSIDG